VNEENINGHRVISALLATLPRLVVAPDLRHERAAAGKPSLPEDVRSMEGLATLRQQH
jgi:hypothetical protein